MNREILCEVLTLHLYSDLKQFAWTTAKWDQNALDKWGRILNLIGTIFFVAVFRFNKYWHVTTDFRSVVLLCSLRKSCVCLVQDWWGSVGFHHYSYLSPCRLVFRSLLQDANCVLVLDFLLGVSREKQYKNKKARNVLKYVYPAQYLLPQ